MMAKKTRIFMAILAVFVIATAAQATVIRSESLVPQQVIPQVSTYQTTGADMAGMEVTAFFSAAPSETVLWAASGADSGAATGTGWSLSQAGDTFANAWTLFYQGGNNGLLTGFRIDGFAAGPGEVGVMFDRTFNGADGTPGSFRGRDFEYAGAEPAFDTFVMYEGGIGVADEEPVGDEFRYLDVRFLTLPGFEDEFTSAPPQQGGLDGIELRSINFFQDTNNPIVPEPMTLVFLGAGAAFVFTSRRIA